MKTLPFLGILAALTFSNSCEQNPYRIGERLYKTHCANCHMDNGEGLGELIPPLGGSDYLAKHREDLACILRYGLKDTIVVNGKTYAEQMLPNDKLSDIHIANLLNFIGQSWGNRLEAFTFEEVEAALQDCKKE